MSQLDPKSPPLIVKRLAIFRGNAWNFFDVTQLEFKKGKSSDYATPAFQFGTLRDGETNPNKVIQIGYIGDYLFKDSQGNLTIIPRDNGKFYT